MYPINNASPERIAVGQVILIADGTIQTSSVVITVRGQGGAEANGAGTTEFGAEGTVYYTPIQSETNFTSFTVIASKASCFSTSQTVVTTASTTAGRTRLEGVTHTGAVIPTVSALTGHTPQTADNDVILSNINDFNPATDTVANVTLVATTTANTDMRGTDGANTTAPDNAGISGIQTDLSNATDGLGAIKTSVDLIPTTPMRGTDNSATEAKQDIIDANVDLILVDTGTTLDTKLNDIQGTTFSAVTDSLEAIRDRGDSSWVTGAGGSSPTVEQIRAEMDSNSVQLSSIIADTAEIGLAGAGLTNIGTIANVTNVTNQVTADVVAISGDTDSANNLELQYDGTGLSGDTFPASQSQVGQLATGSAAISTIAESSTLTVGTDINSYTDTATLNGIYNEISDAGGILDVFYQFDVGGNGVAVTVEMTGRLNGANDDIDVFAYNWGASSWDQIGNMQGSNSTSDGVSIFNLLTRHTGAGADLGKVRIRGFKASGLTGATLYIDQAFVSYAVVAKSVGYALGRIWVDTVDGTAGTESFVNGTADNPCLTFTDAIAIGGNVGIKEYNISTNSTLTLLADLNNSNVYGIGYILELAGFDIAGTHFYHSGNVSGVFTAQNNAKHGDFVDCILGAITGDEGHFSNCSLTDGVTFSSTQAGDMKFVKCQSIVAGDATPFIDFNTGVGIDHNLTMPGYQQGIEIRNLNNGGVDRFSISGMGQIVYALSSSGIVNQRGDWKVTNTGGVTINSDDNTSNLELIIEDTGTTIPLILTDIQGATFDVSTDSLEAIRNQGDSAWLTGAGGSSPTVIQIRQEMDSNSTQLASIVADTNELQSDDLPARFTGLEGATFDTSTDSNEAIRNRGDSAWLTGAGGSSPTVEQIADAVWDEVQSGHVTAGTFGLFLDTLVSSVSGGGGLTQQDVRDAMKLAPTVGAPTAGSIDEHLDNIESDTNELQGDWVDGGRLDLILDSKSSQSSVGVVDGIVDNILIDTSDLQSNQGNWLTAVGFNTVIPDPAGTSPTAIENADTLLNRDMGAVSVTNARSPINALRLLRNRWSVSGVTMTVTEEDDLTPAWTSTVSTDASAEPVTGSDPA